MWSPDITISTPSGSVNSPWEFAFDESCRAFLATSDVRFVRNVLTPVPADKILVADGVPLRILVVSAQPRIVAAPSLAQERALIEGAFRPLIARGAVRVEVLADGRRGRREPLSLVRE